MGRKERARYENNEKVREILSLEKPTPEQIEFVRDSFSGVGGLTNGFNNGQFFTPLEVTYFVAQMMGIESGSVLEPTCGGGAFLRVLPEECDVYGSELMYDAYRVSELCYPNATIRQGDGLQMDWGRKFDYVIGNPPYGLKMPDWKPAFAKTAKSEVAFIEYGMQQLKPGGILGMVIPDSILANQREQPFRKWLMENHQLLGIVSLPTQTFYHTGTSVKTSLLMAKNGHTDENYEVFMAIASEIGWDKRGNPTGKTDLPPILHEFQDSSLYPFVKPQIIPPAAATPEPYRIVLYDNKKKKAPEGQLAFDLGI